MISRKTQLHPDFNILIHLLNKSITYRKILLFLVIGQLILLYAGEGSSNLKQAMNKQKWLSFAFKGLI